MERLNRLSPEGWLLGPYEYDGAFKREEVDLSIGESFNRRAAEFADAPALLHGEDRWTYADLNAAANSAARAILDARGPGAEPVVVLFRKSFAYFAACLGVWKSGKILVSLDASDPPDRIAHIIEDSGAPLILADAAGAESAAVAARAGARVLQPEFPPGLADPGEPGVPISPTDLALLVYTSGSTGRPKGVSQTHRNFLFAIYNSIRLYDLGPRDRIAHLANASFILSTSVMLHALLSGASLAVFDMNRQPIPSIIEELRRLQLTCLHCVPTFARQIAQTLGEGERLDTLRTLRVAGESFGLGDLELLRKIIPPGCVIGNGYGATEMSAVRAFIIGERTRIDGARIPVGYPLEGVQVLLVNQDGEPCETDEPGEIILKGPYISPGYWRRPEETAAAFSPAPDGGPDRLYRTGDLGVLRADGCLEHLGRRDFQIKIRGVRVETGEIEAALRDQPGVKDAAVEKREFAPGDERLVAYYVPSPASPPEAADLRKALAARLPAAMVPSVFMRLDAFPLTATGKVRRMDLPSPDLARRRAAPPPTPPADESETALRDAWEEILGVRPVGVEDDFFDLGGHSMLAARIMIEAERLFGRRLAVTDIVRAPTVRALARLAREAEAALPQGAFVLQSKGESPPVFIFAEHEQALFTWSETVRQIGEDRPIYGVAPSLYESGQPRYRAIETQAALCAEIVQAISPSGPRVFVGFCQAAHIAMEAGAILAARGEPAPPVIAVEVSAANHRRRWIYRALGAWDRARGVPARDRLRRLLRARAAAIVVERIMKNARRMASPRALFSAPAKFRALVRQIWPREGRRMLEAAPLVSPQPPLPALPRAGAAPAPDPKFSGDDLAHLSFATHVAPPYLYCPRKYGGAVTLFLAADSPIARETPADRIRLWRELCPAGFESAVLPGGHITIFENPHVAALAREIKARLDRGAPAAAQRP